MHALRVRYVNHVRQRVPNRTLQRSSVFVALAHLFAFPSKSPQLAGSQPSGPLASFDVSEKFPGWCSLKAH